MKPCFRHPNVTKKGHSLTKRDEYVGIDCCSPGRSRVWTEEEWRKSIDICVDKLREWTSDRLTKHDLDQAQNAIWVQSLTMWSFG